MSASAVGNVWQTGRFDASRGPNQLLFGRMHEDSSIEVRAFAARGRVFCIASAGCTAMDLSRNHEVVAVDINPSQIAYARRRFLGGPVSRGAAEWMMDVLRMLAPAAGWRPSRVRAFLDLDDPVEQIAFWRRYLDTRRFRAATDVIFSRVVLGITYAKPFLRDLPANFGRVMRGRMERGFGRHPNRQNPYARALLLGEPPGRPAPPEAMQIRLVHADAAAFLEREPTGSFDGFALSNVLDAAGDAYRRRLLDAVRQAAAPGAVAVLRSFSEPQDPSETGLAGEDRAMLWGVVDVKPAADL